jgi:hypothetical protein
MNGGNRKWNGELRTPFGQEFKNTSSRNLMTEFVVSTHAHHAQSIVAGKQPE